ncbi:hypothetical protein GLOIN_2v1428382, partial [Rhizophagus irregularis DAOM 181602=DAOM 197198]
TSLTRIKFDELNQDFFPIRIKTLKKYFEMLKLKSQFYEISLVGSSTCTPVINYLNFGKELNKTIN